MLCNSVSCALPLLGGRGVLDFKKWTHIIK
jgi:hypothetical protein